MKATITGAGIGGLTTAIALQQTGIEVEIFEAAPQFKKAGSGINLAINAMQVYKKLGLYDAILGAGSHTTEMAITDDKLKPLSVIDLKPFEDKHKVQSVAIHRATLHKILLSNLGNTSFYPGKKLKSLIQADGEVHLQFEDGTSHRTTVLIGADGIHSVVRKAIIADTELRKAKQICWRGITTVNLPDKYKNRLTELWGKGKRFGFVAINNEEYYWYALTGYNNTSDEYDRTDPEELFSDFHPLVGEIIKNTPVENLLINEIADLKPLKKWYRKNICLTGDAAHATTPNLGQGACQAIESALVLSQCIEKHETIENAFRAYQNIRMPKAHKIVNMSWNIGKMAHFDNGFAIKLRNLALSTIPNKLAAKRSSYIYKIDACKATTKDKADS